jgi:hypothetical protein
LIATACSEDSTAPAAGPKLSPSIDALAQKEIAASLAGRTSRGAEDEILRLEAAMPGLGGLYRTPEGETVVFAAPASDFGPARARLASRAAGVHFSEKIKSTLATGEGLEIRPSKYPFSVLIAYEQLLVPSLKGLEGVLSVDADESRNRVRVSIASSEIAAVVAKAAATAGVPAAAVITEITPRIVTASGLRGTWRPDGGGVQIVDPQGDRCTLGFNVTTPDGVLRFITASHCNSGAIGAGNTGAAMYQPTIGPQYLLGNVSINPPFNYSDPLCRGWACTRADAMLVTYNTPSNGPKRVAFTDFGGFNNGQGSITVTGWWPTVSSPATIPALGDRIDKMGRTTGWTIGTLGATCEYPLVDSANTQGINPYVVLCAGRVDNARWGTGDSGAPVFVAPPSGQLTPLWREGIVFAGSGANIVFDPNDGTFYCNAGCRYFYSQWSQIEAHFGMAINASP